MQPYDKSLSYYISRGYYFASGNELKLDLSSFDTGVVIIDDILDKSSIRNGKPALHEEKGLEFALLEGLKQISNFQSQFEQRTTDEGWKFSYLGLNTLNSLFQDVIRGEILDKHINSIEDYFLMITLFTGNHIAKGVEVGHYMAKKFQSKNLFEACRSAGRIRQIVDDFEDYQQGTHHEPFGDFMQGKNRLPELLFKGDKEKAKDLIKNKQYKDARKYILNKDVREKMYCYCRKEFDNLLNCDYRAKEFVVNFEKILS